MVSLRPNLGGDMRGDRGLWRAVARVAACALLITAGCDGDSDQSAPTPRGESSPSAEPSTPATPRGPAEPTLPAKAEGASPAAAKAFAEFYIEVLDRALTTGRLTRLRGHSAPACSGCSDYIAFITNLSRDGGWRRGGDWVVDTARLSARPPHGFVVSLVISSSSYSLRKSRVAEVQHFAADRFSMSLGVRREGRVWRTFDIFSA